LKALKSISIFYLHGEEWCQSIYTYTLIHDGCHKWSRNWLPFRNTCVQYRF